MIRSKIAMEFLWALLALLLHVLPGAVGPAHAQGSRKDDIIFNSRGIPLAGATVRVCAMPASGQPCTPLALDGTGTELGPLGPGAQTNVSNNWTAQQNLNANTRFKGPNPYVDVTAYGVRNVNPSTTPAAVGLTASIRLNSFTATISSASTFQNGDGVVIYGAGASHAMSTPGAPTVTQSIARVMTGTGDVVTGPTGATTYNYKIIWRDKAGGLTAASPAGTTTTGQASLGKQTVNITSMSRAADGTVTVTTAAANTLITGAMVYIPVNSNSLSDNTFSGWYQVSGSSDNTHFTFKSGQLVSNGASASARGGSAIWFNCNHVTWGAVPTGGYQAYIYGDRANPGTYALLGVAKPIDGSFTDGTFYWDDFGSPMMDNLTAIPGNIPATAPSVATSDNLVTTIVSGAGTTTLTLAANARTSVGPGATIKFDDSPNLLTAAGAAGGSALYIPAGVRPVINSVLDLSGAGIFHIVAPGGLTLNDTLILGQLYLSSGPFSPVNNASSFAFEGYPSISCNAIP
jgi:hypothetical protein